MNKAYYKEYYHLERAHWWFTARSKILSRQTEKLLKGNKKSKILNVGVATGATSDMLSQYGEVTSLEYNKDCCQFLKDQLQMEVIEGSVTALPFKDQSFDLICAFDVIEHVEDDSLAVSEMARVCKSGGHILVTVPALMSLWSEHDEINHHFRRYTATNLRELFQQNDEGKISFVSYFNSILFLPIYMARTISRMVNKTSKKNDGELQSDFSRFKAGPLNKLLYKIFSAENLLLKSHHSFPIGVSILLSWEKFKTNSSATL